MYKRAEKYAALLIELGYRPHILRLHVLRTLCLHEMYTDVSGLTEILESAGISADKEKVRMVVKRLNEEGFLDRRALPGKNKYLFCLRDYSTVEADVRRRIEGKHQ